MIYLVTIILIVAGGLAGLIVAEVGAQRIDQDRRIARRIAIFVRRESLQPDKVESRGKSLLISIMGRIGQTLIRRGLLSDKTQDELRVTLLASGIKGPSAVNIFVGAKIITMTAFAIGFWLFIARQSWIPHSARYSIPVVGAVFGMILPDRLIAAKRKEWAGKLARGLPDALDIMVICTRAGSSIASSMALVATEMMASNPEIAGEFKQIVDEMSITSDIRLVFETMAIRSGVPGMKRLSMTLLQSARYGTPTADALTGLAGEMRQEALTRQEAGAARLGVLLTMPTVCFIMPCVFIVAAGPAFIQIYHSLTNH